MAACTLLSNPPTIEDVRFGTIASLQADLMSAEKKHREKVEQLLKDKDEAIQMVIERQRQANKQVKK
ncbi:hypothetical protein Y032_0420g1148 [Ancylostoma ceylanicum]|nr:hypothetical protein Y032_0420g1148 [Ancylostoma ceylanicum]